MEEGGMEGMISRRVEENGTYYTDVQDRFHLSTETGTLIEMYLDLVEAVHQ